MQHLFQSSFLQALGYAIANSLWQTALVWLLYICITGLLPMTAAIKYRLAVIAQVTGFLWFIFTFQFYHQQYNTAWQPVVVSGDIQNIVSSNTDLSSRVINWMVKGEQFLPYISMAYLLLMLFLCVRWFLGYRQTQTIRYTGLQKMPVNWRLFVDRVSIQLGIKKKIQIFLSNNVTTPLTIGFLKPIILIPVASINHLTTDQLEAVLLHELAHIKRYDYLANIILSVVEISLFFNPFTQLLSKNIRKERENSCDDWVLQFQYNASVYAEALLRIAYLQTSPAFAMTATGKKNDLLVRVKRMIDKKENRFSYRKQLLAFLIVTGILSSVAWLNPVTRHTDKHSTTAAKKLSINQIQTYTVEPLAVSVTNPLFNPVFFLSKPLKEEIKKSMASAQKEMEETVALAGIAKEPLPLLESISPMVTDALQEAAMELAMQQPDWKKDIMMMEGDWMELTKPMHIDSARFAPKMRRQLNENINSTMKKVDVELRNAKKEMQRSANMTADLELNRQELQLNMQKALEAVEELKLMGLDQLVISALKIPGIIIDENSQPKLRQLKPMLRQTTLKRKSHPASMDNGPLAEETIEVNTDNNPDEKRQEEADDFTATFSLPDFPPSPELEKFKRDLVVLIKIKKLLEEVDKKKTKFIPAIVRERKTDDERMVIRLQ
jgi:bla regulator protein BlaR1